MEIGTRTPRGLNKRKNESMIRPIVHPTRPSIRPRIGCSFRRSISLCNNALLNYYYYFTGHVMTVTAAAFGKPSPLDRILVQYRLTMAKWEGMKGAIEYVDCDGQTDWRW